ncbi:hypothetical protein BDM02DRAFT_3113764 [Thelephora ganbajun]|uniref:Uncharacterized protein n=1 Tax=Thelephora ganbajun TaxID=370292 RepID=A0ACB6ZIK2_THEGA|nr:hypothetical protein BDM02DRAFT_3113764 [Thelephora ganbajun]
MNHDWKHPKKKPHLYVPQPPAEGCPINSLPPEILSWIFVLGQQMDLDPEPSPYAVDADPGSDSGHDRDDSAHPRDDPTTHTTLNNRGVDKALSSEPIPVVDDDHENSEWEDEDSERDGDSDNDDLSIESVLVDDSLQVTVSHVCKHWREVALGTPALWSDIDLETGSHAAPSYRRASAYLSRSKEYPLSISIDVNECDIDDESVYSEQSDHQSPMTNVQLREIVDLLLPHTKRWRKFKLTAEDYFYFHVVLSRLCDAPPASLLESLELHHFEEELEPELHSFPYPSYKTPYILFDNCAPKLQHVSLYGVHIDWHNTTFLKNLHSLELAYHSHDVRPSFDDFFTILRSSPGLRTLDLCMSGPLGPPHEWPVFLPPPPQSDHYHDPHVPAAFAAKSHTLDEYMILPRLHELKLSYQSPEDLAAFFNRVSVPSLHTLEINFEDYEYTEFIQSYLIAPPKWQGGSSRESRFVNLKEFRLIQLPCTPKVIAELYATLVNLETIDLDFNSLDEPFWEVFVPMRVYGITTPANQLLPALHTMRVKGSHGNIIRQIVDARIQVELPLKKLFIDFGSEVDKDDDRWLRENVEGVEYFEGSDEDDLTDYDESASSIIEVEMDGFPL